MKIYRNDARSEKENPSLFVPQHKTMDVEVKEVNFAVGNNTAKINFSKVDLPIDNPRASRATMRPPAYFPTIEMPAVKSSTILNIGNNIEQNWTATEDSLDPSREMIDNNEIITDAAFEFPLDFQKEMNAEKETIIPDAIKTSNDLIEESLESVILNLFDNSFLLLIAGVPICSGPLEEIQEQAHAVFVGKHELCQGEPIDINDIVIIKKVGIKVGLFLDRD